MAEVQRAGNIWWGNDDGVWRPAAIRAGVKVAAGLPKIVKAFFRSVKVKSIGNFAGSRGHRRV